MSRAFLSVNASPGEAARFAASRHSRLTRCLRFRFGEVRPPVAFGIGLSAVCRALRGTAVNGGNHGCERIEQCRQPE